MIETLPEYPCSFCQGWRECVHHPAAELREIEGRTICAFCHGSRYTFHSNQPDWSELEPFVPPMERAMRGALEVLADERLADAHARNKAKARLMAALDTGAPKRRMEDF